MSATAIRCTLPSCNCECFAPGKSQIRTCEKCKHGWVAHALDKLTTPSLQPSIQVEVVLPNLVFDVASLVLYGTQAVPVRLKIVLDRLFSVLQDEEVDKILCGLGWGKEDYARGYIVQGADGKVLNRWICVLESEEGAIFNQFLRFGETRSIAEAMIQDLQSQRNTPQSQSKTESNIRTFIERMNRTRCQETFSRRSSDVNSSKCAQNRDEVAYHQSQVSNSRSSPVPSSAKSPRLPTDMLTSSQSEVVENSSAKRRKHSLPNNDNVKVPSIHLANLERTVLNAGSEPGLNSHDNTLVPSDSPVIRIQNSVPQIRKRSSMSSGRSSHKSVLSRRRTKSAFTISASRKRVLCNVCSKWFYDKGTWKIHYSAVHLKVTYKCKVEGCNMVFSSLRSRNRHSSNPNPKIHRIVDMVDDINSGSCAQPSYPGAEVQSESAEWNDVEFENDAAEETDTKAQLSNELAQSFANAEDLIPPDADSKDCAMNLSSYHSKDTSPSNVDTSPTKSLLAARLTVSESCIQNTHTQKRKSNTPVRCLAVDDEEVKGHTGTSELRSELGVTALEDELVSKMSDDEAVEENHDSVAREERENAGVIKETNLADRMQQGVDDKEILQSSVIKTSAVKSDIVANEATKADEHIEHTANSDSNHNNNFDSKSRNTVSPLSSCHPSVPPELAGFSPSVDQMGLSIDNCFFTLDGFPTCILCQKSFQSRQGVKVHYQNVHLRMMHTCTIEGCHAAFPSRRSRDRHSSNVNLHRNVDVTNNTNQDESDQDLSESNSRQRLDSNSEIRMEGGSDTSTSETTESVKVKTEVDQNSNKSSSLPSIDIPPVKSPPSVQLNENLSPAPPPEGPVIKVEPNMRHCLPFESPTLVPLNHAASKINLVDLWTGPRKSQGGLTCDICMKSYSTKDTLRTHYKNVHIREMHKCTVPGCEMMFSSVRSRNRHSQNPNLHRSYQDP